MNPYLIRIYIRKGIVQRVTKEKSDYYLVVVYDFDRFNDGITPKKTLIEVTFESQKLLAYVYEMPFGKDEF